MTADEQVVMRSLVVVVAEESAAVEDCMEPQMGTIVQVSHCAGHRFEVDVVPYLDLADILDPAVVSFVGFDKHRHKIVAVLAQNLVHYSAGALVLASVRESAGYSLVVVIDPGNLIATLGAFAVMERLRRLADCSMELPHSDPY